MSAPMTQPPQSFAICTPWIPTPPPAPMISTVSPGPTRASSRHAWYGVAMASAATAASSSLTPGGIGVTLSAGMAMYSA